LELSDEDEKLPLKSGRVPLRLEDEDFPFNKRPDYAELLIILIKSLLP
jgi:hypothetical protein